VLRIERSIPIGEQNAMRMTLTTPPDRGILKQESWRFEVWRKRDDVEGNDCAVLVATNDAGYVPLPVVTLLPIIPPVVPHRPPLTVIQVEVFMDALDTGAQAFVITAAPGFTFPGSCVGVGGPPINCKVLPADAEGLARARFMCKTGQGTACMKGVSTFFLTLTPREVPPDTLWLVEAAFLDADGDVQEQLGRAELPGFQLVDMPTEISYGALAGVPVEIAVMFESRVNLTEGTFYLHVLAANSLGRFGCGSRTDGFLNPLSVGTLLSCSETRKPWSITIHLNGTMTAGIHTITVPAETSTNNGNPEDNIFEVYLRDAAGRNRDVALRLPGETLTLGIRMIAWPLWWRQIPSYDTSVEVSVPMEILDDANILVSSFLIALPLGPPMKHLGNVQVSSGRGRNLPVSGITLPDQNSVRVNLKSGVFLASGLYTVRFSVQVPTVPPEVDIWRVAICATPPGGIISGLYDCTLTGTARSGRGTSIIAVFTLSGFDPYTAPGGAELLPVERAASLSWRAHPLPWLVLLIVTAQRRLLRL
jgi:hypothetical protein